ncbi:MAG: enoyl-CoA hydratase/isomerase family protein [Gammaproteobacteria bacterium]|nr:enoyl-CoA hydratase/isomerase family protein [Gammaproteobacteria bacterium]
MSVRKDFETIRFELRGRVGLLTLDRPERLNAISARMMDEVDVVLDAAAEDDGIGTVVVCGAGRAFCSGYDLKDDAATPTPNAETWRARLERDLDFLLRFWNMPKPTIAAVHGYCLAGGLELAMSCDITIAEEGCRFGEPELKFGSVIVSMMMPWLIGPKLAKELLLSGDDTLSAERAERIGLVNRVVATGTHVEEALALAARIAALDAGAVVRTKAAINRGFEIMGLHEALRAGLDAAVEIESMETPSRAEFKRRVREQGLKAALAWRDRRIAGSPDAE